MKISEVVEQLRLIAIEHGDIEVVVPDWEYGGTEGVNVVIPFRLLNGTVQAVVAESDGFN